MKNIEAEINGCKNKIENSKNELISDTHEINFLYDNLYVYNRTLHPLSEKEKRLEAVNNKNDDNRKNLHHDLLKLEKEMETLQNKKLYEIITNENSTLIFNTTHKNEIGKETNFTEIRGSQYFPLIKYLLRNGYIDESYPDYMTYFYDNSLSQQDKIFLRRVTDKKAKNYTHELKNSELLMSMLRPSCSSQKEILNFDLLSYLLNSNKQTDTLFLKGILLQLKNSLNYDFVKQFFDTQKEQEKFVIKLNEVWNEFFSTMLTESDY